MEILPNYSSNSRLIRGQNIRALHKILEHKSIKTTIIYVHISEDFLDSLVKLIANLNSAFFNQCVQYRILSRCAGIEAEI